MKTIDARGEVAESNSLWLVSIYRGRVEDKGQFALVRNVPADSSTAACAVALALATGERHSNQMSRYVWLADHVEYECFASNQTQRGALTPSETKK